MNDRNEIEVEGMLKNVHAKDIMSRFAITVRGNDTLQTVAHLMIRFKISGLPVISCDGKIIGIITATDLFRIMGETVKNLGRLKTISSNQQEIISNVMTKEVLTVDPETNLLDIILLTSSKNIHTLPVVKNNEIVGIIGRRDILYSYYKLISS